MANPTKPKDVKPKAEGDEFEAKTTSASSQSTGSNSLITTIAIVAVAAVAIIVTNYVIFDMKLAQISKNISSISSTSEEEGSTEEGETAERGIIVDLGEFILNLSDSNSRRFLKVNVAIELSKKESDNSAAAPSGHGHGESKDAVSGIEAEMNQFKPSVRDAIISVLSSKTSDELNTTTGKELAKEQIKESIDAIFEGDREVLRVSFGSFFIQ